MTTVAEMKRHVSQLVETNRALAYDLDVSRRVVAELSRECDALRERLQAMTFEMESLRSDRLGLPWRRRRAPQW